ncbi:hypothetical protein EBT16_13445 [bacterium]|nr:hypothetical protein [bacterium]
MGLGLSSGGHLTHGFFTPSKKVTAFSTTAPNFSKSNLQSVT